MKNHRTAVSICSAPLAVATVVYLAIAPADLIAQANADFPRTSDGKPDFNGTFEWPKAVAAEKRKSSATIFDRKKFALVNPAASSNRALAILNITNLATSACPAGFPRYAFR